MIAEAAESHSSFATPIGSTHRVKAGPQRYRGTTQAWQAEEKCTFRDVAGNFTNDNHRESEYACHPHNCGRAKQQPSTNRLTTWDYLAAMWSFRRLRSVNRLWRNWTLSLFEPSAPTLSQYFIMNCS